MPVVMQIGKWFSEKASAVKSEFKTSSKQKSTEVGTTLSLDPNDDIPVVIDTYTHKEDIPPLVEETVVDDFEITVAAVGIATPACANATTYVV